MLIERYVDQLAPSIICGVALTFNVAWASVVHDGWTGWFL